MQSARWTTRLSAAMTILSAVGLLSHGLLGYVHLALVPHLYCGHAQMLHGAPPLDPTSAAVHNDHPDSGSAVPRLEVPGPTRGSADPCSICAVLSQPATLARVSATLASPAMPPPLVASAAPTLAPASARHRLAPKQSPPL